MFCHVLLLWRWQKWIPETAATCWEMTSISTCRRTGRVTATTRGSWSAGCWPGGLGARTGTPDDEPPQLMLFIRGAPCFSNCGHCHLNVVCSMFHHHSLNSFVNLLNFAVTPARTVFEVRKSLFFLFQRKLPPTASHPSRNLQPNVSTLKASDDATQIHNQVKNPALVSSCDYFFLLRHWTGNLFKTSASLIVASAYYYSSRNVQCLWTQLIG